VGERGGDRRATYRVQLRRGFGFEAAASLCRYLRDLGVSHLYCSPSLQAVAGSEHGYDVVDPTRLSADLGGEAGFSRLHAAAVDAGLAILLDIVPNHMAADAANPWWWDVLECGESSAHATWFDIDWTGMLDPRMRGRVLLPVLDDHVGRVLECGDLRVERGQDGRLAVRYHEHRFPLSSESTRDLDPEALGRDAAGLDAVLRAQAYRLARWRVGMEEVNYRRFFDITSLVALRAEDPAVFQATHGLVLELLRRGEVDGLRIDHVDGLRLPRAYLQRLRDEAGEGAWMVVEKILGDGEALPDGWPVQGTTGYEFAALTTRLLTDPRGDEPLAELLREMGGPGDVDAEARAAKLQVMAQTLSADVSRLAVLLRRICDRLPRHRDHTLAELRTAVSELVAAMPVYRTYAEPGRAVGEDGAARLQAAVAQVRAARPDVDAELLALIVHLVLDPAARDGDADALDFVLRLQQVSSAVMAKGMEDTTFYRAVALAALNEVGGGPRPFSASVAELHAHNATVQSRWPETLLATTTHDTKRSEDVRARLALLSEIPTEWARTVLAWRGRNAQHRRGEWPDGVMELLLYQSMVGAWPVDRERMLAYMEKASREAKLHTSWIDPSPEYDAALRGFVEALYGDAGFLEEVEEVVRPLIQPGRVNALATALLKLTSPGVPDLYQGCELWTLSLVDPDNRRPVDWELRRALLERSRTVPAAQAWSDEADSGLPKLLLTRRALLLRERHPELFGVDGAYLPLAVTGACAEHVVAFARGAAPGAVTVVPRLVLGVRDWGDTAVRLPEGGWVDQLGDRRFAGDAPLRELLAGFPVALLARQPFEER